ncbi:hypothetical protein ACET3Z_014022 [Daucus carota]
MIAGETPVLFAKAIEIFAMDVTLRSWSHTEDDKRRILQPSDIAAAITQTDFFDFLTNVVPKLLSKPTIASIPEAGSSSMTYQYVPGQQNEINLFMPTMDAVGQQPKAYMQLLKLKPRLSHSVNCVGRLHPRIRRRRLWTLSTTATATAECGLRKNGFNHYDNVVPINDN